MDTTYHNYKVLLKLIEGNNVSLLKHLNSLNNKLLLYKGNKNLTLARAARMHYTHDIDNVMTKLNPLDNNLINFTNTYGTLVDNIGSGVYGSIHLTSKNKIIKMIDTSGIDDEDEDANGKFFSVMINKSMLIELCCLSILKDEPNVIQMEDFLFYNIYTDTLKLNIVLEKAKYDIAEYTNEMFSTPDNKDLYLKNFKLLAYNMVKAVEQVHKHNIIHADIKPQNFLYVDGNVKIADFGVSIVNVCPNAKFYTDIITPAYKAPEIFNMRTGETFDFAVDIWSLGITLFELYSNKTSFISSTEFSLKSMPENFEISTDRLDLFYINIFTNINKFIYYKDEYLAVITDLLLRDLLDRMLVLDPKLRPNIYQVINHPYFNQFRNESDNFIQLSCIRTYINNLYYPHMLGKKVDTTTVNRFNSFLHTKYNQLSETDINYIKEYSIYLCTKYYLTLTNSDTISLDNMATKKEGKNFSFIDDLHILVSISSILAIFKYDYVTIDFNFYVEPYKLVMLIYFTNGNFSYTMVSDIIRVIKHMNPLNMDLIIQELNTINDLQLYTITPIDQLITTILKKYDIDY